MKLTLEQAIESLARTPRVLDSLLRDRSEAWLTCRIAPEAFSAIDVVGHLILADTTNWMPRLRTIRDTRDAVAVGPFDRFAFRQIVAGKAMSELLAEFACLRDENLQALRNLKLTEDDLALPGRHPELGAITLENLLATWVAHDLGHITQITKTMAYEYREAVGPWRAYLSILQ
jgi:hypothetical protein